MIEDKRQVHHRADGDGVINDNDAFLHRADTEDARLRLVDDGEGEERSAHAVIGQCEGSAFDFVWL